ncbi:MAG: proline racemase family protein [Rhodospirillaceae bacterium]|nr:proline racemase family protein [Rhodospirillaceae bacterium]MDE0619520.1 proline racemase family protein [Rhodospirillaceae bacterium]
MRVVDSHTAGEPTRTIVEGGPELDSDLGDGTLADRAARFEADHAWVRSALLTEPRGFDAMVGALLCAPDDPSCATGVIFFNPAGNLGMCGHGTIGVAATLAFLGRIAPGAHRIETPVGVVTVDLKTANIAAVENVESYRLHAGVTVEAEGLGAVTGDVAWGGNWFFLCKEPPVTLETAHIPALTDAALKVRAALARAGITGADGAEIDHIEFFGPPVSPAADSRNFTLCPGGAYDRSPCGTGTSAKLACLAADGALAPGAAWVQESIIGSTYRAHYRAGAGGGIVPTVEGQAFVVGETVLHFAPDDPYRAGIGAQTMTMAKKPG